jgi:hypothetical protein
MAAGHVVRVLLFGSHLQARRQRRAGIGMTARRRSAGVAQFCTAAPSPCPLPEGRGGVPLDLLSRLANIAMPLVSPLPLGRG